MATPTTGALRLLRALVVAALVVGLAAGAHVLGGGSLPPGVVTVALVAVALAACVALTGRRIGFPAAVALLAAGQLALHGVFSAFGTAGCTALVPTGVHAHMDHAAHAAYLATAGCGSAAADATLLPVLGAWAMVVAHGLAALACALVVAGAHGALMWLIAWRGPRLERSARLPALAEPADDDALRRHPRPEGGAAPSSDRRSRRRDAAPAVALVTVVGTRIRQDVVDPGGHAS
jgi:hypothetical protein